MATPSVYAHKEKASQAGRCNHTGCRSTDYFVYTLKIGSLRVRLCPRHALELMWSLDKVLNG